MKTFTGAHWCAPLIARTTLLALPIANEKCHMSNPILKAYY